MDAVIQEVLLEVLDVNVVYIPFWLDDAEQAAVVAHLLRVRGYHVEHTPFLRG